VAKNEWTVKTLKAYVDMRINAADRAVVTALKTAEKATRKAEKASNKRFTAVNEFRQSLSDQTATFIPRIEAEQQIKALSDRVTAAQRFTVTIFVSVMAIVVPLLVLIFVSRGK